jgi:hypothetical protein
MYCSVANTLCLDARVHHVTFTLHYFIKSPKGGKIGPDECTIDRFAGGEYYYNGGCGGMTFEFSITCNDNILEDVGCTFTEVSVSRLSTASTASSYILVMLIAVYVYGTLMYLFFPIPIHISLVLVLAYSFNLNIS